MASSPSSVTAEPSSPPSDGEWFTRWFNGDYLDAYSHRDRADAEAMVRLLTLRFGEGEGRTALDLGCGAGRHAALLAQKGWRVEGWDLSRDLLAIAEASCPGAVFHRRDMRRIDAVTDAFDLIALFFTSFGYFTDDENRALLRAARAAARHDGRLFLDYLNPAAFADGHSETRERRSPKGRLLREEIAVRDGRIVKTIRIEEPQPVAPDPEPGETPLSHISSREAELHDERQKAPLSLISSREAELHDERQKAPLSVRYYEESVALYSREALVRRIEEAGWTRVECFGSAGGEPWTESSPRLIVTARRS